MERMAAFDENFHPIEGVAPVRGQPLPDGVYTLVCKVLIVHRDGTILITQRDPQKKFGGGMWEASGGGTAQAGEDGETCIRRETFEETGIRLGEIKELSRVCLKGMRSFFVEYLAETDWEKDNITLQPGETVAYRWVTKEELLEMPLREIATPRVLEYVRSLCKEKSLELWDAYDENFRKIEGVALKRGEPVPAGMFHIVAQILVRHRDGTYLLMQRDPRKHFGGMWEATAGGSALQGETPLDSALRELQEETGIITENLTELEMRRIPRRRTFYVDYLCETDCPKDSITLQEGETVAYRWVTAKELLEMPREALRPMRMQEYVREVSPGADEF